MGIALGAAVWVLGWITVGLICASLWMGFAVRGLIRMVKGTGGPWASVLAQISVVAMLVGLLRFGPMWGIGALLFPPALLLFLLDVMDLAITAQIATIALPATAIVLALTLYVAPLRPFAIFLTSAALIITTLISGEAISSRAMCTSAATQGLTDITRNTFIWSIPNSGTEYQFNLHAMAQRGAEQFAWSYATMDWYLLPNTIWSNVHSGPPACLP